MNGACGQEAGCGLFCSAGNAGRLCRLVCHSLDVGGIVLVGNVDSIGLVVSHNRHVVASCNIAGEGACRRAELRRNGQALCQPAAQGHRAHRVTRPAPATALTCSRWSLTVGLLAHKLEAVGLGSRVGPIGRVGFANIVGAVGGGRAQQLAQLPANLVPDLHRETLAGLSMKRGGCIQQQGGKCSNESSAWTCSVHEHCYTKRWRGARQKGAKQRSAASHPGPSRRARLRQ